MASAGLAMDHAAGEDDAALRVTFDPRLKLEFHGSRVTSDAGSLAFRDLDVEWSRDGLRPDRDPHGPGHGPANDGVILTPG